MNKGQISYFIVFGIIILVVVAMLFAISRLELNQDDKETNIVSYIDMCIETSARNAIKVAGIDGFGSYDEIMTDAGAFPLYNGGGHNKVPSLDQVEASVAEVTDDIFLNCIDDFSRFHTDVEAGNPVFIVTINERDVRFDLQYPVNTYVDGEYWERSEFGKTIDVDLKRLISETRVQVDHYISKGMYNMSYYAESDYNSTAIDYSDGIIFDIKDDDVHLVYAVQ